MLTFKRLNTNRDQSWIEWNSWHICSCVLNSLQLSEWVQTWRYIHKRWTAFRMSSGSDYHRNDWKHLQYGFEWSTNQSAWNSEATGISQGIVFSIFHWKLGVNKISARWVQHLLSVENKRNCAVAILKSFCVNTLRIHYYTSETKELSKQSVF